MATTGTEKHARLSIMLMKGGTKITRRLLEKRVKELTPKDHTSPSWTVDEFLLANKENILKSKAGRDKEKIYFPGVSDKTNLDHWDLNMFCCVLLESADVNRTICMDVKELRKLRNKLCHLSEPSLDERKYGNYLDKIEVIFERLLEETGDKTFQKEIMDILQSSKDGPLSLADALRQMKTFYLMDVETREILSGHTKDHQSMLVKLDTIIEQTRPKGETAIELPDTDVEIVIKNCNSDKEKRLSELLVKLIDENINKHTELIDDLSNESLHKLKEAVDKAVKTFLSNGRQIASTERKCILLRVRCFSLKDLVHLFRDCISGTLTQQLKPLEVAVKLIPEFEEVTLEAVIYEGEFWKVMEKTVSAIDEYVSTLTRRKSTVTLEQNESSSGSFHTLKLSIPTESAGHLEHLKRSFETGSVKNITKSIQEAACKELNLTDVSIEARLLEDKSKIDERDHQIVYKKFVPKLKKKKPKRRKNTYTRPPLPLEIPPERLSESMTNINTSHSTILESSEECNILAEQVNFKVTDCKLQERNLQKNISKSDVEIKEPVDHKSQSKITEEVNTCFTAPKDSSLSSYSEPGDSGFGTEYTSSSFGDTYSDSGLTEDCSTIKDDDSISVCSNPPDGEYWSEDEVVGNDNSYMSVNMSEQSYGVINEKTEKMSDMEDGRDEYLLQHGIKLNQSFLTHLRSKTAKHPAFYQEFRNLEELKRLIVSNPRKYIPCIIHVEGSHEAYCNPTTKAAGEHLSRIEISGRTKIGQAYDEDEVVVELLDNKDRNERGYGQVLGVLKRHRCKNENIKHPVFLCTPDDAESHIVRPMCKTVPKIHVMHDAIKRKFKTKRSMRFKVEIYEYDERAEILCDNPKIETLSPGDFQSCIFLVAIISWELNQIYPRGAIIKRFPCGETLDSGLAILNLRYNVTKMFSKETTDELELLEQTNSTTDIDDKSDLRTFTIDRHDAKDLNLAFSLEEHDNGYKVGVHIIDVSLYIQKGSPIDQDAYKRALTIHSGIESPRYMLPEQIAVGLCSLLQNEKRPVISIYLFLSNNGNYVQTTGTNYLIQSSFIRCCQNFSYEEAQQAVDVGEDDAVTRDLRSLFRLMTSARRKRLGRSSRILSDSEIHQEEYSKNIIEAHCVTEELVTMVNKKVAEVISRRNISIPVYTQQPPSSKDLESFCQKYGSHYDILVHFQNRPISPSRKPVLLETALQSSKKQEVMLTDSVWENINASFAPTVVDSVLDDSLHPLQSVIYAHWLSIQNKSNYKCSSTELADKEHFGLGFDIYTHCTSPTRRYTDIVVQRMLHFYLEKHQIIPYHKREIEDICVHVNSVIASTIGYQRDCTSLKRAVQFRHVPEMQICFVHDVSDQSIKVKDQSKAFSCGQEVEMSFNLLDMGYKPELSLDRVTNLDQVNGKWRKRLYDIRNKVDDDSVVVTENKNEPDSDNKSNGYFQSLNPYRDVTFIKVQQWARLVKNAADNRLDDLKRNIKHTTVTKKTKFGVTDVSTECNYSSMIEANTRFSLMFHTGQPLNILMHAKPKKGILTPQPMLFEMTENVKLCLQHTDDPVFHLTQYSTRFALDQYRNCKEYTNIWLPIVLMEAAVSAVCNEDGCTINYVQVDVVSERQGKFMLPVEFCEERNIDFSGSLNKEIEEGERLQSYDWLCLKCQASTNNLQIGGIDTKSLTHVWVGHAEVSEVNLQKVVKDGKSESAYMISFNLHESSGTFYAEKKEARHIQCSVEFLRKTDVDRRIESNLKVLHSKADELAVNIALKRKLRPLDEGHQHLSNIIERDLYFSTNSKDPKSKPLPRNNQKQQEAIDVALRNRFTLIQGPPGTGKTYTGIKLIYLFNKINDIRHKEGKPNKQVLFCGPSNKSVDLVAKWMLRRLGNYCPDFIRIYGRATEAEDFPIPGVSFQSKGTKIHRADEELRPITLHHLIRNDRTEIGRKIIAKDKEFGEHRRKRLKTSGNKVKHYLKLLAKASIDEIKRHRVLLCTTSFGSNPKLLKASDVFQVIVDEAGMCPEPQCMVPLIATNAEQIVMIGDHKQLRPIVKCKAAAELGLDKSLFERYATTNDPIGPFVMLDEQYRMDPKLCEFPSEQFYKGKLQTRQGLWDCDKRNFWPTDVSGYTVYPHVLIHIEGEESVLAVNTDDGNEQSRSNAKEIDKVINVYRYLIDENIPPHTINVISQYNAQCNALNEALKKEGFTNYIVNTVVSSQGGEWDYVIFSTVRSLPEYKIETNSTLGWRKHNLGFITDTNQINVTLTRARKGLIIIGNKNLLSCDPIWKKLISHYEQRKCVKLPNEFPPVRTRQQKMQEAKRRSKQRFEDAQSHPRTPDTSAAFASMGAIPKTRVK